MTVQKELGDFLFSILGSEIASEVRPDQEDESGDYRTHAQLVVLRCTTHTYDIL